MKAIAKCPKCGETITTDCKACIAFGTCAHHKCKKSKEEIIDGIKWEKVPETEKELRGVEEK